MSSSSAAGRLSCSLRSLSSPSEARQWVVDARPLSDKLVECLLDRQRHLGHNGGSSSTILASLLPLILEVRVTHNDQLFSNEVFLTLYNGSCSVCPDGRMPQHPTVCPGRPDICTLGGSTSHSMDGGGSGGLEGRFARSTVNGGDSSYQCYPAGAAHPHQPCLLCSQGEWMKADNNNKEEEQHVFSVNQVELHSLQGDRLVYSLPLKDQRSTASDIQLVLKKSPGQMQLQGGRLEWVAEPQGNNYLTDLTEEVVEVVVVGRMDECRELEELVVRITVEQCHCLNGGWCIKGGPAVAKSGRGGSSQFTCECPSGYGGKTAKLLHQGRNICLFMPDKIV